MALLVTLDPVIPDASLTPNLFVPEPTNSFVCLSQGEASFCFYHYEHLDCLVLMEISEGQLKSFCPCLSLCDSGKGILWRPGDL